MEIGREIIVTIGFIYKPYSMAKLCKYLFDDVLPKRSRSKQGPPISVAGRAQLLHYQRGAGWGYASTYTYSNELPTW